MTKIKTNKHNQVKNTKSKLKPKWYIAAHLVLSIISILILIQIYTYSYTSLMTDLTINTNNLSFQEFEKKQDKNIKKFVNNNTFNTTRKGEAMIEIALNTKTYKNALDLHFCVLSIETSETKNDNSLFSIESELNSWKHDSCVNFISNYNFGFKKTTMFEVGDFSKKVIYEHMLSKTRNIREALVLEHILSGV